MPKRSRICSMRPASTLARPMWPRGSAPPTCAFAAIHEARAEIERARRLRPTSLSLAYMLARVGAAEGDLDAARRPLREMEASAAPAGVAAYVALREDLIWALADDQLRTAHHPHPGGSRRRPRRLGARRVGGAPFPGRHGPRPRLRRQRGRRLRGAAGRLGQPEGPGQVVVTRALALALAGRSPRGGGRGRAGRRCSSRSAPGLQSAYVAYVQGRVFALAGEPGRAVERLTAVLAVPAQVSRASFRIDRSLAPLRADAGFQSLIADR